MKGALCEHTRASPCPRTVAVEIVFARNSSPAGALPSYSRSGATRQPGASDRRRSSYL
jgi:hypothetical protein